MIVAAPDEQGIYIVKIAQVYGKWFCYVNPRGTLIEVIVE